MSSNGPDLISHLRDLFGRFPETIEMQKVDAIYRDGLRVKVGRYRLTEHGRQAVCSAWHSKSWQKPPKQIPNHNQERRHTCK